MHIGQTIKYLNYGETKQGRVVAIKRDTLHVERLEGPMQGSIAWIHKQSVVAEPNEAPAHFDYSPWRHGGWYVNNVRYPTGACGCVSRNYEDRKWRIVCDPRPFNERPTFKSRDEAARAEWHLANAQTVAA